MNEDAVKDIADIVADLDPDDVDSPTLFRRFKDVMQIHGIDDAEDRIDVIVAGVEHHFDRQRQRTVSDLREQLEATQL